MTDKSPKFHENTNFNCEKFLDSSILNESVDLYNDNNYKEAFKTLLCFVSPEMQNKFESGQTQWEMPHGSSVIRFEIKDDGFRISAFVSTLSDETLLVPLKRNLCEINFSKLDLANVAIIDGEVVFYYDFLWAGSHPRKVYGILWDICRFADMFDDEFVEKFKTVHASTPQIQITPDSEKAIIYDKIQKEIRSTKAYFEKFQSDRNEILKYYSAIIGIMKIEYFASLQGYYKTAFEDIISYTVAGTSDTLAQIASNCMAFLNELECQENKEKIYECIYGVKLLVPERSFTTLSIVRDSWEQSYENICRAFDGNDYAYVTFSTIQSFYRLISCYNVQKDIYDVIIDALRSVSDKSYKESAVILKDAMTAILNDDIKSPSKGKKGFFKKLFNI
ncbi:MAG: hypothetical protein ACK5MG_07695 [Bacteroidales bacterium]